MEFILNIEFFAKSWDVSICKAKLTLLQIFVLTEGEYIKMFMRGRPITMFLPSDVDKYYEIKSELPPEKLKLEWVYPYRKPQQKILAFSFVCFFFLLKSCFLFSLMTEVCLI